jgi:hypothetical protein
MPVGSEVVLLVAMAAMMYLAFGLAVNTNNYPLVNTPRVTIPTTPHPSLTPPPVVNQSCISNRRGDKLGHKGPYTAFYANHTARIRNKPGLWVLEIGVWRGQSLAVWQQYFANAAMVIGADVFLGPFEANLPTLKALGGFRKNNWCAIQMDSTNESSISAALAPLFPRNGHYPVTFDIIIDDGCHSHTCIHDTYKTMRPWLVSDGGLYFVEDNWRSQTSVRELAKTPGLEATYVDGYTHDGVGGVYLLKT